MRLSVGCLLLLIACTRAPAPKVEPGTKEVIVEPAAPLLGDPKPVSLGPVAVESGATAPLEAVQGHPERAEMTQVLEVPLVTRATVTTVPPQVTVVSELREVQVNLNISGAAYTELAVEFTSPSGQVFDRQVTQLSGLARERQSAQFTLPVMGTLIDSSAIVGTWSAHFFLQGQEIASTTFEVTP